MLERFGARVHRVESAWGENIALDALERTLRTAPRARSLWIVHSETSTGVLARLEEILPIVRVHAPEIIVCVDATSSLGIHPVHMDAAGIDVVIASSQKGVGGLPGLGLVALSSRAQSAFLPHPETLYFDLRTALDSLKRATTPFTPAVTGSLLHSMLHLNSSNRKDCHVGGSAMHTWRLRYARVCRPRAIASSGSAVRMQ